VKFTDCLKLHGKGLDQNVLASLTDIEAVKKMEVSLTEEINSISEVVAGQQEAAQVPEKSEKEVTWKKTPPKEFNEAVSETTKPQFLYRYTEREIESFLTYTTHGGKVGFALTPEKDIVNVYNNSGVKGAGTEAMVKAITEGGETLDCFDGFLCKYYKRFGFEVYKQDKWNEEYAPKHWDYSVYDKPDVVFLKYKGGTRNAADIRRNYETARLQEETARGRGPVEDTGKLHERAARREGKGLDKEKSAPSK